MGYAQQSGGGWSGDILIAAAHQLQIVEQAQHVHLRRVPHKHVSVVLNRAKAPHHLSPVFTGELDQPPSRFAATRMKTINLRRTVTDAMGEEHVDEEEDGDPENIGSSGSSGTQPFAPAERPDTEESSVHDSIGGVSDYWTVSTTAVVRHHMTPRVRMYTTNEGECPIPLRFLDVIRFTFTNLEDKREIFTQDTWIPEAALPEDTRRLSGEWTGTTIFRSLRPESPVGFKWFTDKLVKCRDATRPDDSDPELWRYLSKLQRKQAAAEWQVTEEKRAEARATRGRCVVLPEEKEACPRVTKENKVH